LRLIRALAALAATLTYALIVLGAVVRSTGSGISCPDWPTCYGHWVLTPASFAALPPTGYAYWQVMLEWVHRLVAGFFLGPLILALVVTCLWNHRRVPGLGRAAVLLVVLLLGQALLGGITVLDQNSPWSVALHLSTALLLLTTLLWIVVSSARVPASGAVRPPLLVPMAGLAWVLALLAMAAAAMTAKSGASLACATWPTCNGAVIPDLADPLVRIHFAHRVLAALSSWYSSSLAARNLE
jgi:cytochrome c oxidase assembly protein subunit 15